MGRKSHPSMAIRAGASGLQGEGHSAMETCWVYLAVSSRIQVETLPHQREWAEETAQAQGWEVTRIFGADAQGVSSGKHGTRKLLQRLLVELERTPKAQRPKRVLMIRLDRLGRGMGLEAIAAFCKILELGVVIHTRQDGDLNINRVSDVYMPIIRILTGAAENEGRKDKSGNFFERRRKSGQHVGNLAPYGTTIETQDGVRRLVPREPQASTVRRVYELRLSGMGYERISRSVYRDAPPHVLVDGSIKKPSWHRTFVRYMLRCRSYRGLVVDEGTWEQAQITVNPDFKLRGKQRFPWPLTGSVRCECGYSLTGSASGRVTKRIRYYLCPNFGAHGGQRVYHRAERIEEQFQRRLEHLAATPEGIIAMQGRSAKNDRSGLDLELRGLQKERVRIEAARRSAWDLEAKGTLPAREIAERLEYLRQEQERTEGRIVEVERRIGMMVAEATVRENAADLLSRASRIWAGASVEQQKAIALALASVVSGVFVSVEGKLTFGTDAVYRETFENSYRKLASALKVMEPVF